MRACGPSAARADTMRVCVFVCECARDNACVYVSVSVHTCEGACMYVTVCVSVRACDSVCM